MLKKFLEHISIPTPKHLKPEPRKRVLMRRYLAVVLCGCMMVPTIGSVAMATEPTEVTEENPVTPPTVEAIPQEDHPHNNTNCETCGGSGEIDVEADCPDCDGPAEVATITCEECGGAGKIVEKIFSWDNPPCPNSGYACNGCADCQFGYAWVYNEEECTVCHGSGTVIDPDVTVCETCGGKGAIAQKEKCTVCEGAATVPCTGEFGEGIFTSVKEDGTGILTHTCPVCNASYETVLSVEETTALIASNIEVSGLKSSATGAKLGEDVIFTLTVKNNNSIVINEITLELAVPQDLEFSDITVQNGKIIFDHVSIAGGESKEFSFTAKLPAKGIAGTTYQVSLNEISINGEKIVTDDIMCSTRINEYDNNKLRICGMNMGRWLNYIASTAGSDHVSGSLDDLINKPFTAQNLAADCNNEKFWSEFVINYQSGVRWQCVGFIPSKYNEGIDKYLKPYVFSKNETLGVTSGTLEDAKKYIVENNGVLYGETAAKEQLASWQDMFRKSGSYNLIAVWYVPYAEVNQREYGELNIEAVNAPELEETSDIIDIVYEKADSKQIGDKYYHKIYATITINPIPEYIDKGSPEYSKYDMVNVVVNLRDAINKELADAGVQPGDAVRYEITLNDQSGRNYQFVDGSAVLRTLNVVSDLPEDTEILGTGFDGYKILYGDEEDISKSAIPKRTVNSALVELGVLKQKSLIDEAIGVLLREKGYGQGEDALSNEQITQKYLGHYYLDYINANREMYEEQPIDSFQDASNEEIRMLLSDDKTGFGGMGNFEHVFETCKEVAEAYYYFYYGRIYRFGYKKQDEERLPLFAQMQDENRKDLNNQVKEVALHKKDENGKHNAFNLITEVDGETLGNSGQDTFLTWNFGFQLKLKPATVIVKKVWSDGGVDHRNDSITVKVYNGEEEVGTLILNAENNWEAKLENQPYDGEFSVKEIDAPDGYKVIIAKPVFDDQECTQTFTITNAKEDQPKPDSGSLTISKSVTGTAGDKTKAFHFNVELKDASGNVLIPANIPVSIIANNQNVGTEQPDYNNWLISGGKEPIVLTDGQSVTISNLPVGTTYKISETEANADGYQTTIGTGATVSNEATGNITTTPALVTFTNHKDEQPTLETGSLVVTKIVSGNRSSTQRDFTFTVTLRDADGNLLTGSYPFTGSHEGNVVNGTATFLLRHGQSITISNLPVNTRYEVSEEAGDYSPTVNGGTGTIAAGQTSTASFDNYRSGGGGGGGRRPTPDTEIDEPPTPQVYYPGEEPDPNEPDSPEEITIVEEDVPQTYIKTWDPENEEYVYIPEEPTPLAPITPTPLARLDYTPKTDDPNHPWFWFGLCFTSILGIGLLKPRKKHNDE